MTSVWNVPCSNCGEDTGCAPDINMTETEEALFCAHALCDNCVQSLETAQQEQERRYQEDLAMEELYRTNSHG